MIKNDSINKRTAAVVCKKYSNNSVFIEESFNDINAALCYRDLLNTNEAGKDSHIDYVVFIQDPDDYSEFPGMLAMVCYESYDGKSIIKKRAFTDIKSARGAACALCDSLDGAAAAEYFVMVETTKTI